MLFTDILFRIEAKLKRSTEAFFGNNPMAKVSLDMNVKNEDEPLNSTSRIEPLIQENETWKLILPKKLQSKIEGHKKLLFAYFCTLVAFTILILSFALLSWLFLKYSHTTEDLMRTLSFIAILLVSRAALCVHTKSFYPNGLLLLLAMLMDFLLIILLFSATIFNYIVLSKCPLAGNCAWFGFSLLVLLWTSMMWIILVTILIFQNRGHYKINSQLFRRLYKRFDEELKRHIKYD